MESNVKDNGVIRKFDTGATRDTSENKLDFEAILCPAVLHRYTEYMNGCRKQSDGTLRDGDNWQKGIPIEVYTKSLIRHVMDVWLLRRNHKKRAVVKCMQTALCAVIFNAMGLLHELLLEQERIENDNKN